MGKLRTLKRAIDRDPHIWHKRIKTFSCNGEFKWRNLALAAQYNKKLQKWEPYTYIYGLYSYKKFVKHILNNLKLNVE